MKKFSLISHFLKTGYYVFVIFAACEVSAQCINNQSTERLKNFCFLERHKGREISPEFARFFDYRLKQAGYANGIGLSGSVKQNNLDYQLAPVIYYSSNINGGNPNKKLILGNLEFEGYKSLISKKGMLVGGTTGFSGRSIYDEGKFLDYNFSTSYAHSINHKIGIFNVYGNICAKNHIKNFWHLDICTNSYRVNKKIIDDYNQNMSINLTKLFSSLPGYHHEASFGINRKFLKNYSQNQAILGIENISFSGISSNIKVNYGSPVSNILALKNAFDWSFSKQIGKNNISLFGNINRLWDGKIFGQIRNEKSKSINIGYKFSNGVGVTYGITDVESNIDYYSSTNHVFNINFIDFNF